MTQMAEQMAVLAPSDVIGIHLNMPSAVPAEIAKALQSGGPRRLLQVWPRVRERDETPTSDAVRDRGFAGRPGRLDPRP